MSGLVEPDLRVVRSAKPEDGIGLNGEQKDFLLTLLSEAIMAHEKAASECNRAFHRRELLEQLLSKLSGTKF